MTWPGGTTYWGTSSVRAGVPPAPPEPGVPQPGLGYPPQPVLGYPLGRVGVPPRKGPGINDVPRKEPGTGVPAPLHGGEQTENIIFPIHRMRAVTIPILFTSLSVLSVKPQPVTVKSQSSAISDTKQFLQELFI